MAELACAPQFEYLLEPTQNSALELVDFDVVLEPASVISIPEMASDNLTRHRAARFIGSVLLGQYETPEKEIEPIKPIESLAQGIHLAHEGDRDGYNMVRMNVTTDVIERVFKTGHVGKAVPLVINENNKIVQFRQLYDSVQANSLRSAREDSVMLPRTKAETRNGHRMEQLWLEGLFEEHSMVVFSPAENRQGFFTETMSLSIQVTSKHGDALTIEPAFVSGIAAPGLERHDLRTIAAVGERLGVDLRDKTASEIIDTPLLIPNSMIPNGAIDVVKLYDDINGTFFGENRPRQDYLEYRESCRQREESFSDKFDQITNELIAEAPRIHTPSEAVDLLDRLSGKHMVEKAIVDNDIDTRVFGSESAHHIEQARIAYQTGELDVFETHRQKAIDTEKSFSCPAAKKDSSDKECEFISKKCPICGKKNVKTTVTKTHIEGKCGCKVPV